jgi:hypothetical protein
MKPWKKRNSRFRLRLPDLIQPCSPDGEELRSRVRKRARVTSREEFPQNIHPKTAICSKLAFPIPGFLQNRLQSGTNVRHSLGQFVIRPFVFIHISGSTFIFYTFLGGSRPPLLTFCWFEAWRNRHDGWRPEASRCMRTVLPRRARTSLSGVLTKLAFVKNKMRLHGVATS